MSNKPKIIPNIVLIVIFLFIPRGILCSTNSTDILILKKRASSGIAVDEYLYGRALILGKYSKKQKDQGILYVKKAASKGYAPAILFLAQMYEKGFGGIKRDYKKAYKWYKKGKELGLEVAKIKLAPFSKLKKGKKQFKLFGINLKEARRFSLRYILELHGASPISLEDNSYCDIFKSNNLISGTDRLQVCYGLNGKFILLEYRYPPKRRGYATTLASMLDKLKKKYGTPKEIRKNNLVDEYYWERYGISIYFWMEPKTNTCFLRYVEPKGYKQLYDYLKAKNSKKQIPKVDFF